MTRLDVRRWRQRHKLTQAGFADLLRLHVSTIAHWEQGRRRVPHWLAASLAALKVGKP